MRRIKNIYDKICNINNIKAAIIKGAKGKRNRKEVRDCLSNIDECAKQVQMLLITKTYVPCKYKENIIREGAKQKERVVVKINFFPDQIIHWAMVRQLQPFWIRSSYKHSCGSMPGRGPHYGKKTLEKWLHSDRKNTKYAAKLDIKKFYASVNHEVIKSHIRSTIKDVKTIALFDKIIDSYPLGMPIGYLTSQWLANSFLTKLDNYIKQELGMKYYMRYMDDMVLLSSNKKFLHRCVRLIAEFLQTRGLVLKENWQVFKVDSRSIDFMGFRFFRTYTTLRKKLLYRIIRKVNRIKNKGFATNSDASSVLSYLGWLKYSNSHNVFKTRVSSVVSIGALKKKISAASSCSKKRSSGL